jgi:hypothetical protein
MSKRAIQTRVNEKSLATVYLWLKRKGEAPSSKSRLISHAIDILANSIVKSGFPMVGTDSEAQTVLAQLGLVDLSVQTEVVDPNAFNEALQALEGKDGDD